MPGRRFGAVALSAVRCDRRLLAPRGAARAQLLIFEDLHWADATSLRLFAFLAAELDDSAMLVVGTYRDTELSRQHPLFETLAELARSPACQRIELQGLSARETAEFARGRQRRHGQRQPGGCDCTPAPKGTRCSSRKCCATWSRRGRRTDGDAAIDDARLLTQGPDRRARSHRQALEPPVGRWRPGCCRSRPASGAVSSWTCWPGSKPTSPRTSCCMALEEAMGEQLDRSGAGDAAVPLRPCPDPRCALRRDAGPAPRAPAPAHR